MKSKYIIIERDGIEAPLVFSRFLQHEHMAQFTGGNVLSAGFCKLDSLGRWVTDGESVSLKLNVRPQDAQILNAHLGMGGFAPQPDAQKQFPNPYPCHT